MPKKQLITLFISSLMTWMVFSGLIGLIPVYAVQLGADSASTGYYLAVLFLAWGLGATVAGWLSDRLRTRKHIFIACNAGVIPFTWAASQVNTLAPLIVLTFVVWFLTGAGFAIVNVLIGLSAKNEERGRAFGVIALSSGLGITLGGLLSGPIVDHWGFPALFIVTGFVWIIQPAIGFLLEDHEITPVRTSTMAFKPGGRALSYPFTIFLVANILAYIAVHVVGLAQPLVMNTLAFDATAISSAVAVSGVVTIPVPLLFGSLSDRIGRKPLLAFAYLCGAGGLFFLSFSAILWQFWIVAVLRTTVMATSSVGRALVTDLVPEESLGLGLSLYGVTVSISSVLSLSVAGNAIQLVGMSNTLIVATLFPLAAIGFLFLIQTPARQLIVDLAANR